MAKKASKAKAEAPPKVCKRMDILGEYSLFLYCPLKSKNAQWHYAMGHQNGQCLMNSEGIKSRSDAMDVVRRIALATEMRLVIYPKGTCPQWTNPS